MSYTFKKGLSDAIIGLEHDTYGLQLWVHATLRKPKRCAIDKCEIPAKATAFSPLTNGYNRMHRICLACAEKLQDAARPPRAASRSGRTRGGSPSAPAVTKTRTVQRRSRAQ